MTHLYDSHGNVVPSLPSWYSAKAVDRNGAVGDEGGMIRSPLSSPHDVVIIGAGGFGREVLCYVRDSGLTNFLGFLDDGSPNKELLGRLGVLMLGGAATLATIEARYLIGVGSPVARRAIDERAMEMGRTADCVRHPMAYWRPDLEAGPGLILCPGSAVTTNVRMGRHAHVNLNATIGHDVTLGDYVTVNPGANISGNVTIGNSVLVGSGSVIIEGLVVGGGAVVGAGAVVVRDVEPGTTVVGSPARPLRARG